MRKLMRMRIHISATLLFTSKYETSLYIILFLLTDHGIGKHICFLVCFNGNLKNLNLKEQLIIEQCRYKLQVFLRDIFLILSCNVQLLRKRKN
jgi:hypothetical protein